MPAVFRPLAFWLLKVDVLVLLVLLLKVDVLVLLLKVDVLVLLFRLVAN